MWDLRQHGVSGNKMEKAMEMVNIITNKNTVVGDKSAFNPNGIRLGACALTTRGFVEKDMELVAKYMV
jgi:glycine hydroxymethyltransferase